MFWETGGGRGPVPARQLYRIWTARARHGAKRTERGKAWLACLPSRYALNTHGVRAGQDQQNIPLLLTGLTARALLQTVYDSSLIFLHVGLSCFHIHNFLILVFFLCIKSLVISQNDSISTKTTNPQNYCFFSKASFSHVNDPFLEIRFTRSSTKMSPGETVHNCKDVNICCLRRKPGHTDGLKRLLLFQPDYCARAEG